MVEIYKLKFTILQQEILRFLFIKAGKSFNAHNLAKNLKVSQTGISKALPLLAKENIITVEKDKESKRFSIKLNRDNINVMLIKRAENLKMLYESGLVGFLEENFPGTTIILFGSFSRGDDTFNSDIDIAIIGTKEKEVNLANFKKILDREIIINFYDSWKNIHKNLKNNVLNGIVLAGGIEL